MTEARRDHRVAISRGNRDYVHAVDMLRAAPISPADPSFKFRFYRVLRHPGSWQPVDEKAGHGSVAAELSVQRQSGPEKWALFDDPSQPLVAASDLSRTFEASRMVHTGAVLAVPISPDLDFWEQLVEAVRCGGDILFPGKKWLTVGISGNGSCLVPLTQSTTLTLELENTRGALNTIRFSTSEGKQGRILTAPRPA